MSAQAIGSLFVSLGLDTALFTAGMKNATSGLGKFAGRLQGIGAGLSAAVTGPLVGLALGAQRAAQSLSDLDNQARIAGLSAQQFKILAMASEDFGINQEKVADILKDVNDKMGDFAQTGAGPMKDFFEKIAPKVGVTAEMFKDLNGADALALYVSSLEKANVSQAEMTFYMEAIASDATALLPVFADNAKALKAMEAEATRLGLNLDGNLIGAAKATERQFRITKDVLGIQFQQALVELAPAVSRIMEAIVPMVQKLAEGVAWLADTFSGLSPETQVFIASAVGISAALGPVLLAVGTAIPLIMGVVSALAAVSSPALALVAAIAAVARGAYLIYENWDGIKTYFTDLWESVKQNATAAWEEVKSGVSGAATTVIDRHVMLAKEIIKKWDEIVAAIKAIPAKMIQIGEDIINGLKQGIEDKWRSVQNLLSDITGGLIGQTKEELDTHSPSRVFRQIGGWITEGLGLGIVDGMSGVQSAMAGVADAVGSEGLTGGLFKFRDAARGVFSQVAFESKSLGDTIKSTLGNWFGQQANNLFNSGFDALWGGLGLPSFANGTNNFAGGLAQVNERGGEIMNLPSGTQIIPHDVSKHLAANMGGVAGIDVTVTMDQSTGALGAFVTDRAGRVLAQARPQIVQDAVKGAAAASRSTKTAMGI